MVPSSSNLAYPSPTSILRVGDYSLSLIPGTFYLRTCPELEGLHCAFSEQLNIIICLSCGVCVNSQRVRARKHFDKYHKDIAAASLEPLYAVMAALHLPSEMNKMVITPKLVPPMEGLTVHSGGFMCSVCGSVAGTLGSARSHRSSHKDVAVREILENIFYQKYQPGDQSKARGVLTKVFHLKASLKRYHHF